MITNVSQRWSERRACYRLAAMRGEHFAPRLHDVAVIEDDTTARAFVESRHYSASYPPAVKRFGLYRGALLLGVFVSSVPTNAATLANVFPDREGQPHDCGRFVLAPEAGPTAETWFHARVRELLRADDGTGLLAFSDDVARTIGGRVVFGGHIGTIYQASNARFLGRGTARTLRLFPDGRVMSARSLSKIRARDKGWRGAVALLESYGAPPPPADDVDSLRAWLAVWLPRVTSPLRHPGPLRYAWLLDKRATMNGTPRPYPKIKFTQRQVNLF